MFWCSGTFIFAPNSLPVSNTLFPMLWFIVWMQQFIEIVLYILPFRGVKLVYLLHFFIVFQDMPNNDRQTYFSDESLTRDIYSNWIKGFLARESQQNLSYPKKLCNFQTWSKVKVHWFCILEEIHFFTKGQCSKSTSKTLSETSSITTITDAVEVMSTNPHKKVEQTNDSNILSLLKRVRLRLFKH